VTRLSRNPDVIWDRVDGSVLLCHTRTGEFFRLNETGAQIWDLCEGGSPDDLLERLARSYPDEPRDRLAAATTHYLAELRENHLLMRG